MHSRCYAQFHFYTEEMESFRLSHLMFLIANYGSLIRGVLSLLVEV